MRRAPGEGRFAPCPDCGSEILTDFRHYKPECVAIAVARARVEGVRQGESAERARIVAFLRGPLSGDEAVAIADAIERGEHLAERGDAGEGGGR